MNGSCRAPRRAVLAALAGCAAAGAGCGTALGALREASRVPVEQAFDDGACTRTQAPVLLVLLPGAHMTPTELQRQGFVTALRRRALAADVVIVGTQLRHVREGSAIGRLRDEVLAPARRQGYRRFVLAGISLGGYLSLHFDRLHPGEAEALVVLAPYLGRDALLQQIAAAGGPAAWQGAAATASGDAADADVALWRWLAGRPAPSAPIWMGAGSDDRFAAGHRMLAGLLPPQRVHTVPGGHDWAPWRALWARWLDGGPLPTTAQGCA